MFHMIINGFVDILTVVNLLWIVFGTLLGIIIGAIPGLTATMGVALLLPLTFGMDTLPAISMLLGIYCGGMYGGSITAILINTPGTPAAAATSLDGYPLAKKGQAGKALKMAIFSSTVGGLFSALMLILIAPQLAKLALKFGPPEYFALVLLGLTVIAGISGKSLTKGLIAGSLGLLMSCIGLDPMLGMPRLTFGNIYLSSGLSTVPVLIGLFAIAEILENSEKIGVQGKKLTLHKISGDQRVSFKEFKSHFLTMIKGSLIGTYIGIIPGIGSGVSAFVSYNEAKRSSKHPENFGKGEMAGVVASESANNGATGATLIP
ncbi:MAG: tripartite tricarboxylate transporter permease, partial [Spirochaetales bacterium]|nr:tripartite tricarboxylate transporter permease [Spirochaetales bacterium]